MSYILSDAFEVITLSNVTTFCKKWHRCHFVGLIEWAVSCCRVWYSVLSYLFDLGTWSVVKSHRHILFIVKSLNQIVPGINNHLSVNMVTAVMLFLYTLHLSHFRCVIKILHPEIVTRKPCCRRESARCRCNFRSI